MSETRLVTCERCQGTGAVKLGVLTLLFTCPTCKGRGLVTKAATCETCGEPVDAKTFRVSICSSSSHPRPDEQDTPRPGTIEPVKKTGFAG